VASSLTPLLWFLVKEGLLPWVKLGWEWQDIKRPELKKRLEDHARELGLKPEPADKAIDALLDKLMASGKNARLVSSLMSVLEQTEDADNSGDS
jgi:hypothetical protein